MYLNTKQAAAILNVSRHSLINYVNQGLLVCYLTPGGHRRYLEEDIRNFYSQLKVGVK